MRSQPDGERIRWRGHWQKKQDAQVWIDRMVSLLHITSDEYDEIKVTKTITFYRKRSSD